MAEASEHASAKEKRRQYSREKKMEVLTFYYEIAKENKYRTCQKFGINKKCLLRWIAQEETIRKAAWGAKWIGSRRRAFWPDVEVKLLEEFEELRQKGLKVKNWWFRTRARQLMEELHPEADFKMYITGTIPAAQRRILISK